MLWGQAPKQVLLGICGNMQHTKGQMVETSSLEACRRNAHVRPQGCRLNAACAFPDVCKHAQHGTHPLLGGSQGENLGVCKYIYTYLQDATDPPSSVDRTSSTAQTGDGLEELSLRLWWMVPACLFGWKKKKKKNNKLCSFMWRGRSLLGCMYLTSCGGQAQSTPVCGKRGPADFGRQRYPCPVCTKGGNRLLASKLQTIPSSASASVYVCI